MVQLTIFDFYTVQEASESDVGSCSTICSRCHVPFYRSYIRFRFRRCHRVRFISFSLVFMSQLITFRFNSPLVIVCAILTYVSVFWYTLSYIPFARDTVKRIFGI